jgi:hypothetical protein
MEQARYLRRVGMADTGRDAIRMPALPASKNMEARESRRSARVAVVTVLMAVIHAFMASSDGAWQ